MSRIIVDCSVTIAWAFPDEATAATATALSLATQDGIVVPVIWPLEVANVLAMSERRGRITEQKSKRFLRVLHSLNVLIDPIAISTIFDDCLNLARRHQLTTYDASYLELALRSRLPLHSKDVALLHAASAEGVPVIDVS
jgi:predicted nucleic acid-binding protein